MSANDGEVCGLIIEDVIRNMKPDASEYGLSESIMDELKTLWLDKLDRRDKLDKGGAMQGGDARGEISLPPMHSPPPPDKRAQAIQEFAETLRKLHKLREAAYFMLYGHTHSDDAAHGTSGAAGPSDSSSQEQHRPPAPAPPAPPPPRTEAHDDDDEVLSSASSDSSEEADDTIPNRVFCQFTKVRKNVAVPKNNASAPNEKMWKAFLKEGVFETPGRVIFFKDAVAEMKCDI